MYHQERSTSSFLSLRARIASCVSMLICGIILLTSCALPWETRETTQNTESSVIATADSTLDRQSLVRELAACISDTKQISYVYNMIPPAQLDGISYATFSAYIKALTYLHIDAGVITSFRFVNKEESQIITDGIAVNAANYQSLLSYTIPVELFYSDETTDDSPVYIYIQEDANGTPYLSSAWVKECLNIFDFAGMYFTALEKQNSDAVASLLNDSQMEEQGGFSSAVINYKARELVQYYHLKVQSPFSDYRLRSLDISQLTYMQPEVLDDISLSYQTRNVRFIRNSLDKFTIRDSVNNPLSTKDFYLYYKKEKTIRIGDRADSNQFLNLFGKPQATVFSEQFTAGSSAASQQIIVLTYSSASVTIKGTMYDDGSWDGQIIQIQLKSGDSDFVLGTIFTNMTRDSLMMLYPFADQTDYILSTTLDDQSYEMTFTFADDPERTITGVKLILAE